jgi:hypothetical protein
MASSPPSRIRATKLYGAGTVFDGEAAVRGYFAASRMPFPDQTNEIIAIAAEGHTVLVEFWLTGTYLGPLRTPKGEIASTGKAFRVRMMASFEFAPGSAKIICERPYFDRRAVITGAGTGWSAEMRLGVTALSDSFLNNFRLTDAAGKSFSKSLASECFRDEVNKDPCLRRH